MPKLKHTNLTPCETANIDNINSNVDLTIEHDSYGENVVKILREENITLCHELAVHRELLTLLSNKLGITTDEFEELNEKVEFAKEKAKENKNESRN